MKTTSVKPRAPSAAFRAKEPASVSAPSSIEPSKRSQAASGGGLPLSADAPVSKGPFTSKASAEKAKKAKSQRYDKKESGQAAAQPGNKPEHAGSLSPIVAAIPTEAPSFGPQKPPAAPVAAVAPEIESCVKTGLARALPKPVYSPKATQAASREISAKNGPSAVGRLAQLPTHLHRDGSHRSKPLPQSAKAFVFEDIPPSQTCVMNPALIKPVASRLDDGALNQLSAGQQPAIQSAKGEKPETPDWAQERLGPLTPQQKTEFETAWREINASEAAPSVWGGWKMAQFLSRIGQLPTREPSPFDAQKEEPRSVNATLSAYQRQMQRHWVVSWLMDTPVDEREKLVAIAFGEASEEAWQATAKTQGGKTALKNARSQHEQLFEGEPAPEDAELLARLRAGILASGEESAAWGAKLAFLAAGLSLEKQASIRAREKNWFDGEWQEKMESALREAGAPEAALQPSHARLKHVSAGWAALCEKRVKAAFMAAFGTRAFFSRTLSIEWGSAKLAEFASRPNPQTKIRAEKSGQPLRAMNWPDDSLSAVAREELSRRAPWIAAQATTLGLMPSEPKFVAPRAQQVVAATAQIRAPRGSSYLADPQGTPGNGRKSARNGREEPDPLRPHMFPRPLTEQRPEWIAFKANRISEHCPQEPESDSEASAGWPLGHGMPFRQSR